MLPPPAAATPGHVCSSCRLSPLLPPGLPVRPGDTAPSLQPKDVSWFVCGGGDLSRPTRAAGGQPHTWSPSLGGPEPPAHLPEPQGPRAGLHPGRCRPSRCQALIQGPRTPLRGGRCSPPLCHQPCSLVHGLPSRFPAFPALPHSPDFSCPFFPSNLFSQVIYPISHFLHGGSLCFKLI